MIDEVIRQDATIIVLQIMKKKKIEWRASSMPFWKMFEAENMLISIEIMKNRDKTLIVDEVKFCESCSLPSYEKLY